MKDLKLIKELKVVCEMAAITMNKEKHSGKTFIAVERQHPSWHLVSARAKIPKDMFHETMHILMAAKKIVNLESSSGTFKENLKQVNRDTFLVTQKRTVRLPELMKMMYGDEHNKTDSIPNTP